jgi:predicted RNA binding protein YcfA (HicA-like mRNA interferase family)
MPPKIRELKAELRKAGFTMRPGKGSHTVWEHLLISEEKVTLAGDDGDDAPRYLVQQVRKALAKLREAQRRPNE